MEEDRPKFRYTIYLLFGINMKPLNVEKVFASIAIRGGMDAVDFIRPRLSALLDHSEEIYEEVPGPTNEFDAWSALKLILHSVSIRTYTKIHKNQGTQDLFYIDALAGTGLSEYEGGHFLGSALLASREAYTPFSKMYFVESDEASASVLEKRLEYAFKLSDFTEPRDWEVYPNDANDVIPEISDEIRSLGSYQGGFNYYGFIDNQAADVKWSSIEELTPKPYGDLLINIPLAQTIGRNINKSSTGELNKFYGEDLSKVEYKDNIREQCRERYLSNLASRGRSKQVVTEVHGGTGSFRYDLGYVTRPTRNDNPWLEAIRYARDFIEKFHGGDVQRILDVIQGPQDDLEQYLPDRSIDDEVLDDLEDDVPVNKDGQQSDLTEFS